MNRSHLIEALSARTQLTQPQASRAVQAVFAAIADALVKDVPVELRGLFSFRTKLYPAREGRNPKTGAIIGVRAKRLPVMRVSKALRAKLSEADG